MNTTKERLTLDMTVMEAVLAIAGGNPGAINVCMGGMRVYEACDPDSALKGLSLLMSLDNHRIYESKVWVLYKDVCGQSFLTMFAVLRAAQLGLIQYDSVKTAVDNADMYKPHGLDLEKIIADVKAKLPRFGVDFHE